MTFYAFIGFEDMVNLTEEVRRPERDMAVAIVAALLGSALLYTLVTTVAVLAVPPAELAEQSAPLAYVMGRGGNDPWIAAAGLVSVTNSALAQIVMSARIPLGLARNGLAPTSFARIGPRRTLWVGTLACGAVALVLARTQELDDLARATSAIILLVFALVNISALALRRHGGPLRLQLWIPLVALAGIEILSLSAVLA